MLYVVNINAFPHRRADENFENDGFVSCNPKIPQELNVSYTPNPLVAGVVTTFEVAGRFLIDAPRKFSLHIFIDTDIVEYHDSSDVETAKPIGAGDLFNFYENLTIPTLSEHYKIKVSLDSFDTKLTCANKTVYPVVIC